MTTAYFGEGIDLDVLIFRELEIATACLWSNLLRPDHHANKRSQNIMQLFSHQPATLYTSSRQLYAVHTYET